MSLFARNANLKLTETDLIAFEMHELTGVRERAVRRAIEQSAALEDESASIAETLALFAPHPVEFDRAVLDRSWAALRPALAAHSGPAGRESPWLMPLVGTALLAALVLLAFLMLRGSAAHPYEPAPGLMAGLPRNHAPAGNAGKLEGAGPLTLTPARPLRSAPWNDDKRPAAEAQLGAPSLDGPLDSLASSAPGKQQAGEPEAYVRPLALAPVAPSSLPMFTLPAPMLTATMPAASPAQQSAAAAQHKERRTHTTDLMLGLGGNWMIGHNSLTAEDEPRGEHSSTGVAGLLAFHQQFRRALGYRVAASYTQSDFTYSYSFPPPVIVLPGGGLATESGHIDTRIFELAGTYVVKGPHRGRVTSAADAGAGLLAFLPTDAAQPDSYVFRGAGVLGVSAEIHLSKHWGAHAAYRAQVFKTPDFRYTGGAIPVTANVTVSQEPSVGITYQFGKN